jgi:6-phosphogluconolactonase
MSQHIFPDSQSLIDGAANYIADLASKAIGERGRFTLALSGGNTPRPVFARLSETPYAKLIDWTRVHIFFGDERCVPPDDERSNYHMARGVLLDHVPLVAKNVHPIHGEEDRKKRPLSMLANLRMLLAANRARACQTQVST